MKRDNGHPGAHRVEHAASRFDNSPRQTAQARRLRAAMTKSERRLWAALRGDSIGFSFRRQHPIGPYVLDFYCPALRLSIEVDGDHHAFEAKMRRDRARSAWLAERGIRELRFWSTEVSENISGVLEVIVSEAAVLRAGGTDTGSPAPGA